MSKYLDPSCEDNRVFFAALEFAEKLHLGQRRKSGAPYISHPCAVAEILARELQFKDPHLLGIPRSSTMWWKIFLQSPSRTSTGNLDS